MMRQYQAHHPKSMGTIYRFKRTVPSPEPAIPDTQSTTEGLSHQPLQFVVHLGSILKSKFIDTTEAYSPRNSPSTRSRQSSKHRREPCDDLPSTAPLPTSRDISPNNTSAPHQIQSDAVPFIHSNLTLSDNWMNINGRFWFVGRDNELDLSIPSGSYSKHFVPEKLRNQDILQLDKSQRFWTLQYDHLSCEDINKEDFTIPLNICGLPVLLLLPREHTRTPNNQTDPLKDDPIDPYVDLSYEKYLAISKRFPFASGFCLWINGHLQLLAPDMSPKQIAREDIPPLFGGLIVSVSRCRLIPTASKVVTRPSSPPDSAGNSDSDTEKQSNGRSPLTMAIAPQNQSPLSTTHPVGGHRLDIVAGENSQERPQGNDNHLAMSHSSEHNVDDMLLADGQITPLIFHEPHPIDTDFSSQGSRISPTGGNSVKHLGDETNCAGIQAFGTSGQATDAPSEATPVHTLDILNVHPRPQRKPIRASTTTTTIHQLSKGDSEISQIRNSTASPSIESKDTDTREQRTTINPNGEPSHHTISKKIQNLPRLAENPLSLQVPRPSSRRSSWPSIPMANFPDTLESPKPRPPGISLPSSHHITNNHITQLSSPATQSTPSTPNSPLKLRVGDYTSTAGLLLKDPKTGIRYLTGSIHAIYAGTNGKPLLTRGIQKKRRFNIRKLFPWLRKKGPEVVNINNVEVFSEEQTELLGTVVPQPRYGPHVINTDALFPDIFAQSTDACLIALSNHSNDAQTEQTEPIPPLLPPRDPPLTFYSGPSLTNFPLTLLHDPVGTEGESIWLGAYYPTSPPVTIFTEPKSTSLTPEVVRGAILYRRYGKPLRDCLEGNKKWAAGQASGMALVTRGAGWSPRKDKETARVGQDSDEPTSPMSRRTTVSLRTPRRGLSGSSSVLTRCEGSQEGGWTRVVGFQSFEFAPPGNGGEWKGTKEEVDSMLKAGKICVCGATRVPAEMASQFEILGG